MENEFNFKLREKVKEGDPRSVYRRIEDRSGNLGTFDTFLMTEGHAVWIELKQTETPGQAPKMRLGQPAFGRAILAAGGQALVLVHDKRTNGVRVIRGDTIGADWRRLLLGSYPMGDFTLGVLLSHCTGHGNAQGLSKPQAASG